MKKTLLTILLILAVSPAANALVDENGAYYDDRELGVMAEELQGDTFYRSPISNKMPTEKEPDNYNYSFDYGTNFGSKELDPNHTPLVKQMRIKAMNMLYSRRSTSEDYIGQKRTDILNKVMFWKNKGIPAPSTEELITNSTISDSIKDEIAQDIKTEDTLAFETGINEQVTEKQLQLDCENVNFDEETGDMIATGRPLLYLPPQNTKVIADQMIYNESSNILKGIGNVIVIKDGMPTLSDYIEIDMNEETMISDKVSSHTQTMIMDAQQAVQKDSLLILTNGNFHSDESEIHRLQSRMIGPAFQSMIVDESDKSLFFGDPTGNKLHIKINKLYVDAGKNHDIFRAKHIEITRNGKHWLTWPSLTAYTNKDRSYFEANYPEFGSKRKLGMFIGPGFVFGGPGGSVVKVIPFLNYQHSKFGFGGALKYRNVFNHTELGYGTANNIFFLRGTQRLDDNLYLQYSANSFMDEWFLGSRMPKYMAEIFYDKRYNKKDFLAENRDLSFRHRFGFGLMEDNDRNYYGEKLGGNGTTTTKLRYMAEIAQNLYKYRNDENRFYVDVSIALQGAAAIYGTGDTQFIGRIGPRVHVQYKNWMQDIGYYQSGYSDETPVPRYDAYRYGHSSLYLTEIFRINKYLSVGWSGYVNLSDDSPNGKIFQENRFVVAVGPDDLKVRFGYDFVRQMTYFGFDVAFDTKGTSVTYGKMVIKNPERFGRSSNKEERKLAFTPATQKTQEKSEFKVSNRKSSKEEKAVLEYAQVIEIEDPDKETVQ